MKVKLTGTISGSRDGADWPAKGEVMDLPDDEAEQLVNNGMAVYAVGDDEERAVAPEAEERSALTTKSGPGKK